MTQQARILIHIPHYEGHHDGATRMVRDYVSRTIHDCVILTSSGEDSVDGDYLDEKYDWADIIITHLGTVGEAINTCKKKNKPLIWISHNTHGCRAIELRPEIGIIYNADWTVGVNGYKNDHVVCHPMCVFPEGQSNGYFVTLINCCENKGGDILAQLAERDIACLGVEGAYGKQVEGKFEFIDHTDDIVDVLKMTKVLIMPSKYESWGRTGVEAMCLGVPVIAHETPGIRESLGDAAWYCDRNNIEEWVEMIRRVDGHHAQKHIQGAMATQLAKIKEQAEQDVVKFDEFIIQQLDKWQISNVSQSKGSSELKEKAKTQTAV